MGAPDGNEFKLLMELECMFGAKIAGGSPEDINEIEAMIEAGRNNTLAHELFPLGTQRAKENNGSCTIDAETPEEIQVESVDEMLARNAERQRKRSEDHRKSKQGSVLSLHGVNSSARVTQSGWALLAGKKDWEKGAGEFRAFLKKRKFPDDVELVSVTGAGESSRFASRIHG